MQAMSALRQPNHEKHGPIPAFDHQLKTLSDSYIAFMTERVKIEDHYILGLSRLQRNIRALDNLLDDRDPSSVRVAWRELRDNVEREAEARTAFANTIRMDVLPPLKALREEQERTRKRIYEDLKDGTSAHIDYLENTLPRLKRQYLKKCQEVEDLRAIERPPAVGVGGVSAVPSHPAAPSSGPPTTIIRRVSLGDREFPLQTHMPTSSASALSSSASQPTPRNRSPSSANPNPLSDLAHQGKKGFNQLIGFLDQGRERDKVPGLLKENGEKPNGLKSVRAKREADEADKEYRKGVHWLETLRLRRVKILQAGANSLEAFVGEFGDLMKKALTTYADGVSSTASICASLANHGQTALTGVSTEKDSERVHHFVEFAFLRSIPPQIYYWNYHVSECKDLIFGFGLVDYATNRGIPNEVPSLIWKCVHEVETRGLDTEGIYRVPGRHATVQELLHQIERDERSFAFRPTDDLYAICGVLKMYLRELPEPVFKFPIMERVQHTRDREEHISNGFLLLRSKIRRLPPVHQVTLRAILEHLAHVAANSSVNKMDCKNLAIVFGTVIFGEDEMPKPEDVLAITTLKDTVMEDLITYVGLLFEEPPKRPASGSVTTLPAYSEAPLPNPPPEEPLTVELGSAYTKVTTLPPRRERPAKSSREAEDFAPRLPSQPQHSIHPSRARSNNPPLASSSIESVTAADSAPSSPKTDSEVPEDDDVNFEPFNPPSEVRTSEESDSKREFASAPSSPV